MGLVLTSHLDEPITDKESTDEYGEKLICGASSMQGWRESQEDAHNCCINFDEDTSLFAVYDGHGGHEVAEYCSENFPEFLKQNELYKKGDYVEALKDAFMKFDALLTTDGIMEILKKKSQEKHVEERALSDMEEENVDELKAESNMPIEEVISKYQCHHNSPEKKNDLDSPSSSGIGTSKTTSILDKKEEVKEKENDEQLERIVKDEKIENEKSNNEENENDKEITDKKETEEEKEKKSKSLSIEDETIEEEKLKNETCKDEKPKEFKKALDKTKNCEMNGEIEKQLENGSVKKHPKTNKLVNSMIAKALYQKLIHGKGKFDSTDSDEEDDDDDDDDESFGENESTENGEKSDNEENDEELEEEEEEDDDDEDDEDEYLEDEEEEDEAIFPYDNVVQQPLHTINWLLILVKQILSFPFNFILFSINRLSAFAEDDDFPFEEPGSSSGCTANVALLRKNTLYVANAGDSRCVVSRQGEAIEMSFDHKPESLIERTRIEKAGGTVSGEGRVNSGLNLSRAIGDHSYKQNKDLPAEEQMITALPDIKVLEITPEDEFMILACDGIWNCMSNQEVVDFIRKRIENKPEKLSSICEELFDNCLTPDIYKSEDGAGCDNMTALIIQFKSFRNSIKRPADEEDSSVSKRLKSIDNDDNIISSSPSSLTTIRSSSSSSSTTTNTPASTKV